MSTEREIELIIGIELSYQEFKNLFEKKELVIKKLGKDFFSDNKYPDSNVEAVLNLYSIDYIFEEENEKEIIMGIKVEDNYKGLSILELQEYFEDTKLKISSILDVDKEVKLYANLFEY